MTSKGPSHATTPRPTILVSTDGSSLGNPGFGGWAWYVDEHSWAAGATPVATNNQMELLAIRRALEAIPTCFDVVIETDSSYAQQGLTKWIHGWMRRGWVTSTKKPVANKALFQDIYRLMQDRSVTLKHVRGHAGNVMNEAADTRCYGASTALRDGKLPATGPGFTRPIADCEESVVPGHTPATSPSATTAPTTAEPDEQSAGRTPSFTGQGSLFPSD